MKIAILTVKLISQDKKYCQLAWTTLDQIDYLKSHPK